MPARRLNREPALSLFPAQLRLGDRFTDADGEWEVVSLPVTFKQGHEVRARIQQPDDPKAAREKYWAAHEKITVRRKGCGWRLSARPTLLTSCAPRSADCAPRSGYSKRRSADFKNRLAFLQGELKKTRAKMPRGIATS